MSPSSNWYGLRQGDAAGLGKLKRGGLLASTLEHKIGGKRGVPEKATEGTSSNSLTIASAPIMSPSIEYEIERGNSIGVRVWEKDSLNRILLVREISRKAPRREEVFQRSVRRNKEVGRLVSAIPEDEGWVQGTMRAGVEGEVGGRGWG